MIGDACLQEGVDLEAVSLAGHWRLNNLCVMYDNNTITCNGTADVAKAAENINSKIRATDWVVIDVLDGHSNVSAIVHALLLARSSEKPTFLNIHTVIGFGSEKAETPEAHGAALGIDDIINLKKRFGLDPEQHYYSPPPEMYRFFADIAPREKQLEANWSAIGSAYEKDYPELAAEFKLRVAGKMRADWTKYIPKKGDFLSEPTAVATIFTRGLRKGRLRVCRRAHL